MLISATATSLMLQTAETSLIVTGALAGLFPDVDVSTSLAGRMLPWVSRWLEQRKPHRSCTHSLVASGVIALATYPVALWLNLPIDYVHAINTGYCAGWFADMFTAQGVQMCFPSTDRWVVPRNRKYRLGTNSQAEYGLLAVLVVLAIVIFNINSTGGMLQNFNRLLANPDGVEQVYNKMGGDHLIIAHIKGVLSDERSPIAGDFLIVQGRANDFIVESKTGQIYRAGTSPDCQLLVEQITADPGPVSTTEIESVALNEDEVKTVLAPFRREGAIVFVSGHITVRYSEDLNSINLDSYQFPTIKVSEADKVTLDVAPLNQVFTQLGSELATGHLSVKSIYAKATATINSSS